MSLKEKLLQASVPRVGEAMIEGEKVRLRELTTPEFAEYSKLNNDQRDDKGVLISKGDRLKAIAHMISVSVIDEGGNSLFTADEAIPLAKSPRVSLPIVAKVMELCGLEEEKEKHPIAS